MRILTLSSTPIAYILSRAFLSTMRPRPPISTLFPYTTLFRSNWKPDVVHVLGWMSSMVPAYLKEYYADDSFLDRKSTRLNSSHVAISYAVFCLKKKEYYIIRYSYTVNERHVVGCLNRRITYND